LADDEEHFAYVALLAARLGPQRGMILDMWLASGTTDAAKLGVI
jgi:hypothetical protein